MKAVARNGLSGIPNTMDLALSGNVYLFTEMYEELFSKPSYPNLALALQTQFLDWSLLRFGKELFICILCIICI